MYQKKRRTHENINKCYKMKKPLLIIGGIFFMVGVTCFLSQKKQELFTEVVSPNREYKLCVYRDTSYRGFPGSSSDASGLIVLTRIKDGKCLFRDKITMVQLVDDIKWEEDAVRINHIDGIRLDGTTFGEWGGARKDETNALKGRTP